MGTHYPPAGESRERLHRAVWRVGHVGTAGGGQDEAPGVVI
jgi:hypothetical protein